MIGSEGTLGIITELTLRLHPLPSNVAAASCAFPTLHDAAATVTDLVMSGGQLARIGFLDEHQVHACNLHSKPGLPEKPTLFLEFRGSEGAVREQAGLAQELAASHGGIDFKWAMRPEDRTQFWRARHMACFTALALRPGCVCVVADVCVPISALADAVAQARADIDREGLAAPILGHVGDGNLHLLFLQMPDAPQEREAVDRVYAAIVQRALDAGGTCTGEHGIDMGNKTKLLAEVGPHAVELMRATKRARDPKSILHPGRIFQPLSIRPPERGTRPRGGNSTQRRQKP